MVEQVDQDYLVKIFLIGSAGCGKSQIFNRYTDETFMDSYVSTIGIDFGIKQVQVGNKMVKFGTSQLLKDVQKYASDGVLKVLVGSKKDLSNRVVQYSNAKSFAESKNISYFEVSSKTGEGINDLFDQSVQIILNKLEGKESHQVQQQSENEKASNKEQENVSKNFY